MSSNPRSVLKKRATTPDSRRVSFADPLSSGKANAVKPAPKAPPFPVPKKTKSVKEPLNISSLVDKQNEILGELTELETKYTKQKNQVVEMINELAVSADCLSSKISESSSVLSALSEQEDMVASLEMQRIDLVAKADAFNQQMEESITAEEKYAAAAQQVNGALAFLTQIDNSEDFDESIVDFDNILKLVDNLEAMYEAL